MNNGPEDSKFWREKESVNSIVEACLRCKKNISYWHCDDRGCPWCHECGSKANPNKDRIY